MQPLKEQEPSVPINILQNSYEAASNEVLPMNNAKSPTLENLPRNKRKRSSESSDENSESSETVLPPRNKKKRRSDNQPTENHHPAAKKDKLYCICKTRYDPKK